MDNRQKTLELGTKPVGSLLVQYAMPAIIAMIASSLYNIIDRIFIGQVVGPMAISGLAITFPFMNLLAAFGSFIGVGSATVLSIKLGQKDYEAAERILGANITLNVISGTTITILSLVFLDPILRFFGASDNTLPYARDFMQVISIGTIISHLYFGLNGVLRSVSKPKIAMYATILTVVLNIILVATFIGLLHWGIRGAALATVIAQSVALIWQITIFSNKKELIHFKRGIYKLRGDLVKLIIGIGISPFLMNLCASVIVIFMNKQLVKYGGDLAVGAYGIANSIATVFVMFVMGLNQGMQPIAGYNFGAMKFDRMMKVLSYAIAFATVIMTAGWLIAMFLPQACARLFTTDPQLMEMAVKGIRIDILVFPVVGYQMVVTTFFQCIGKVRISIFLSLSRQLLFLLPLLLILPLYHGLDGVWYSLPSSDFIAAILTAAIMTVYMRKLKKRFKAEANG